MTDTAISNAITLKGSATMIREFFYYGISSILYQRGVYGPHFFNKENKYGLQMMVVNKTHIMAYLKPLLDQVEAWLGNKNLQQLVFVIMEAKTRKVLERWIFDIQTDADIKDDETREKNEQVIKTEMANVIKQITSSVTFLPDLNAMCTFDVLCYTSQDVVAASGDWANSTQCLIENPEEVDLRKVSTNVHRVAPKVQYKASNA